MSKSQWVTKEECREACEEMERDNPTGLKTLDDIIRLGIHPAEVVRRALSTPAGNSLALLVTLAGAAAHLYNRYKSKVSQQ